MTQTSLSRRHLLVGTGTMAALAALPLRAQGRTKIVIGQQDAAFPEFFTRSGAFEDLPYDLEWAILQGPAANLSALHSGVIDAGQLGPTSLILEQARDPARWTETNVPIQIIGGWQGSNPEKYPVVVTAVRTSANIETLADIRGKRYGYNFGATFYLQQLFLLIKAGLTFADVEAVQFPDGASAAAAFNSGQIDVFSGSEGAIRAAIDKGEARILLTSNDLDLPAFTVVAASRGAIDDPAKATALADFLTRLDKAWEWYAQNVDAVQDIYEKKLKQRPDLARYSAEFAQAEPVQVDEKLIASVQGVADALFDAGDIREKIDVRPQFNATFR